MDPITQGLMGSLVSQSVFQKKIARYPLLLGIIAATIGDLDILIRSNNPMTMILYHRQFSRSFIGLILGSIILSLVFYGFCKPLRPYPIRLFSASFLAYASHIFLDVCTSYGTQLYWPWSNARVTLNILPIVDPVMLIILAIGFFLVFYKVTNNRIFIPLILVAAYIGFANFQHNRAESALKRAMPYTAEQPEVMPTIGQLYIWHSIYKYQGHLIFNVITVPYLARAYLHSQHTFPLFNENHLPMLIRRNNKIKRNFSVFKWFSNNYLVKLNSNPLVVANGRYVVSIDPLQFLWSIELNSNGNVKLLTRQDLKITKRGYGN